MSDGIVYKMMTQTDAALADYGNLVFGAVAAPIQQTLILAGIVSLILFTFNLILQFKAVNVSSYLLWCIRFVLIYMFATVWANFETIYTVVQKFPAEYGETLIKGVNANVKQTPDPKLYKADKVTDVYSAIDEFGNGLFYVSGRIAKKFKWYKGNVQYLMLAAVVAVIGIIFIGAAVVIVLVSKVGFAVAIGLAPLAIGMLIFQQTRGYFDSWLRFAVGFSVVPLLVTVLMTVVISVAVSGFIKLSGNQDMFRGFMPFVMIALAALVLMFQIPTMANALAGTSVAAVGAAALFAMPRLAKSIASTTFAPVTSTTSLAKNMAHSASSARAAGASRPAAAFHALAALRVNSQVRQARLYKDLPALGGRKPDSLPARQAPTSPRPGGNGQNSLTPTQMAQMRQNT